MDMLKYFLTFFILLQTISSYAQFGLRISASQNDYSEWNTRLSLNKEKMNSWIEDKVDIKETISLIGEIDKSILEISNDKEVDLIIMGMG